MCICQSQSPNLSDVAFSFWHLYGCSLHLCLSFCFANKFIYIKYLFMTKMFRDVGSKDMNPILPLEGKRRWNPIRKSRVRENNSGPQMKKLGEDTSLENTRTCNLFSHYDLRTSGAFCLGWRLGKIIALTKVQ